jgi:putative tryptophan/tyrosine transport system substrate-binding protein
MEAPLCSRRSCRWPISEPTALPTHSPGRYHSVVPRFANSVSGPDHWGVLKFNSLPQFSTLRIADETARIHCGARQSAVPVIGFLNPRSPDEAAHLVAAFHGGLSEGGFVEGQNVTIEYRWALGQYDRLPAQAAELVHKPVTVLVALGSDVTALAAKAATATIPIVFATGGDVVKEGLVASHNRPGGNATGVNVPTLQLDAKRLGLLHEIVPQVAEIGVLLNPREPLDQLSVLQEAARVIGLRLHVLRAGSDREIEVAFETIVQQRIAALLVAGGPFFDTRRDKLVALAARHAVPTVYQFREYAFDGGLMSYGFDLRDFYRQAGLYAARILKGEKPGDLPVQQPTKFELLINLKTAKALGLTIPPNLLALADEVIE